MNERIIQPTNGNGSVNYKRLTYSLAGLLIMLAAYVFLSTTARIDAKDVNQDMQLQQLQDLVNKNAQQTAVLIEQVQTLNKQK